MTGEREWFKRGINSMPDLDTKHLGMPGYIYSTKLEKWSILSTHPFLSNFVPDFVQTERLLILAKVP